MTSSDLQKALQALLSAAAWQAGDLVEGDFIDDEDAGELVQELDASVCETFADAGVLTSDQGLVLRLEDGSEFQITIQQSGRAVR